VGIVGFPPEAELAKHAGNARRWEKYRWVAECHNAYIAAKHPGEFSLLIEQADSTRSYNRMDLDNTPPRA
jgi:hypothetical protein